MSPHRRPRAASQRRAPAVLDDRGQGLGEYALILGFIAVLCVAAAAFVGTSILTQYQNVSSAYP
ncbi:MAG: Flp family type IVb pilin [Candidatus Velthaea sp.]